MQPVDRNTSPAESLVRLIRGGHCCDRLATNIARPAGATRVHIPPHSSGDSVLVEISEDGCGITDREATNVSSMGLPGVRERAIAFGGSVSIEGTPVTGTRLAVRLPLVSG